MRKTLEDLTDQLGVKNDVIFMGNRDDVNDLLGTWYLFVYATTNQEGLGNTVSKAMANGLPCVVSDLLLIDELKSEFIFIKYFFKWIIQAGMKMGLFEDPENKILLNRR